MQKWGKGAVLPAVTMAAASSRVFQFKLVLLGDSAVGKSSLVLRFVRGQFFEYQESTIGAAFLTQTVALNDTTVKFEIWDTAGQERYHSLAPMYYRGAAAAIVVYDITNRVRPTPCCPFLAHAHQTRSSHARRERPTPQDTFQRAKQWVKELQRQGNPNIVIALAGNKSDLNSKRKVEPEVGPHPPFPCHTSTLFTATVPQRHPSHTVVKPHRQSTGWPHHAHCPWTWT